MLNLKQTIGLVLSLLLICSICFSTPVLAKTATYLEPNSTYVCDFEDNYLASGLIADRNNPNPRCSRGEILTVQDNKFLNFYADNNKENFRFEIHNNALGNCILKQDEFYTVSITYKVSNIVKSDSTDNQTTIELIRYDGESEGNVIGTFPNAKFSGGETTDWQTATLVFKSSLIEEPQNNILAIKLTSPSCPTESTDNENLVSNINFDNIIVKSYPNEARSIIFETNGGEYIEPLIATANTEITLPTPKREMYEFAGWFSNAQMTAPYTGNVMPNGQIKLFAKWEPVKEAIVVTFDSNGGEELDVMAGKAGQKLVLPKPARNGFRFVGWYDKDGNRWDQITKYPSENTTLTAKYENQVIVVNFENIDDHKGLSSSVISGRYALVNNRANFGVYSLEYATAKGWNPNNFRAQAACAFIDTKGERVTIENGKKYKVSFYLMVESIEKTYNNDIGGRLSIMTTTENGSWEARAIQANFTYTPEDISNKWVHITREFVANFGAEANYVYFGISGYSVLYIDDVKLWQVDEQVEEKEGYSLSFDTDGGTWIDTVYGNTNDAITLPEDPTKEGYVFKGWYSDITLETPFNQEKFADDNVVAYAAWEKIPEKKEESKNPLANVLPSIDEKGNTPILLIIIVAAVLVIAIAVVVIVVIKKNKK